MEMMPERDSAQKSIQNYATQLEDQLKTMQDELEKKYNEYMASQDKMSNLIKQTKEKELQELNKRITDFQASAQKDIHTKETELLDPIVQKARKAVEEVGKENKFTHIYDISGGMVLYFSPESEDVMPLVKTKLGIKK
jgi:outer membrane protein